MIKRRYILLLALIVACTSCTTTGQKKRHKRKAITKHKNMTLDKITAEDGLPGIKAKAVNLSAGTGKEKDKTAEAAKPKKLSQKRVASCLRLYDRFVGPYKNLAKALPANAPRDPQIPAIQLLALERSDCGKHGKRKSVVKTILATTDNHTKRIALILPVTGPSSELTRYILDGYKAAFAEAGMNFNQFVLVKDTGGNPRVVEQRLAEAIFVDQATMVLGGITPVGAQLLVKWAEPLFIPTMLLARDTSLTDDSAFAFRVYPDERRLANTIAETAQRSNLRRIAILRPSTQKSDQIVEFFRQKVQEQQGTIVHDLIYQPDDFDSMEFVTRELFQLDIAKRGHDYRRAFYRARQRANRAGMAFNPRNVVIDPIVEFDAVFVPDDFRIVRHFTKLFKYHGVRNIPMLGNHEWRSPALLQPWDEFLQGSYFADFIGSYQKLPRSIGAPTTTSQYFVKPDEVVPVDFRLIGYRTGYIARVALAGQVPKRRHLASFLEKLPSQDESAFGKGRIFDEDHSAKWPTYVFRVDEGNLVQDFSQQLGQTQAIGPAPTVGHVMNSR